MDCIKEHLVYFSSSFSELLEIDKYVTIHHRNLQTLTHEILTENFHRRKAIIGLEIAQRCKGEVLRLSRMAQKLYLVWDQKYGTFYRQN